MNKPESDYAPNLLSPLSLNFIPDIEKYVKVCFWNLCRAFSINANDTLKITFIPEQGSDHYVDSRIHMTSSVNISIDGRDTLSQLNATIVHEFMHVVIREFNAFIIDLNNDGGLDEKSPLYTLYKAYNETVTMRLTRALIDNANIVDLMTGNKGANND